ncbi:MAG TPA: peptide chain release factor N(5)-glutamine methyltransferase [Gemmatimonadaceae bacterium]|jgi:release factor glutamine methyltransferase
MTADGLTKARTVARLAEELARALDECGIAEPVSESREIVAALFDVPRFWSLTNGHVEVDDAVRARAQIAVERRALGAPFAYAVGRANFRHLTLDVDERVLIPRMETEHLVDLVLEHLGQDRGGVAVDVGTGSGCIALALATESRLARVYATDISLDALAVARANVTAARRSLRAAVDLVHGSLLRPLLDVRCRVVVSNPPYIALSEAEVLPASVRNWEPAAALFSGGDGLAATGRLVRQAAAVLEPDGLFAIEVDARRASLAAELVASERRFHAVRLELDLAGRERFVLARRLD